MRKNAIKPKVCHNCGVDFYNSRPAGKFCSNECHVEKRRADSIKRRSAVCIGCGIGFVRAVPSPDQKYCVRACFIKNVKKTRKSLQRKLPVSKKSYICKNCGERFHKKSNGKGKYCSSKCAIKDMKKIVVVSCSTCGDKIERSPSGVNPTNYCGRECQRKRGSKKKKHKINPLLRWEILERDNFTCIYCNATGEDGVKLHVDHFIPRSRGGKDEKGNLVTSCFDCNVGKADRIVDIGFLRNRG